MDSDSWLFLDAMGDERSCSVLGVCCVGGAFVCACVFDVVCFGQPPLGALPLVGRGRRIFGFLLYGDFVEGFIASCEEIHF